MWWPDDPNDSKSLFLSLSAGLIVAMVNLGVAIGLKITKPENIIKFYWSTLASLFILFLICIIKFAHIRKGLDKLDSKNKIILKKKN